MSETSVPAKKAKLSIPRLKADKFPDQPEIKDTAESKQKDDDTFLFSPSLSKPVSKPKKPSTSRKVNSSAREPATCRCSNLEAIQQRFYSQFREKKEIQNDAAEVKGIEKRLMEKKLKKLYRLSRLADDLKRSLVTQRRDVVIKTKNEKALTAHSVILGARTKLKIADGKVGLEEFSFESVEYYLSYVYTASMDWTLEEQPEVRRLAELYGPTDLALFFSNPDDDLEFGQVKSQDVDLNVAILNSEGNTEAEEEEKNLILAEVLASQEFVLPKEIINEKDDVVKDNNMMSTDCIIIDDSPVAPQRKELNASSLRRNEASTSKTCSPSPTKKLNADAFLRSPSVEIICCNLKQAEKSEPEPSGGRSGLDTSVDLFETPTPVVSPVKSKSPLKTSIEDSPPYITLKSNAKKPQSPKKLTPRSDPIKSQSPKKTSPMKRPPIVSLSPPRPCPSNDDDSFLRNDSIFDSPPYFTTASNSEKVVTPPNNGVSNKMTETDRLEKIRRRLGSGAKIVKTTNVTPMPNYECFTEEQLKAELKKFGLRPMGKKRAIEELKKIYEALHPLVDLNSETPKKAITTSNVAPVRLNFEDLEEKTSGDENSQRSLLNDSVDEVMEESAVFDDEKLMESPTKTSTGKLIKDVETAQKVMLDWLKLAENEELYNSLLSMQPVTWNELVGSMSRSSHDVRRITKKILADVLDRLHITFTLPDVKWGKGKGYKNG